jgi:hypothetical protein
MGLGCCTGTFWVLVPYDVVARLCSSADGCDEFVEVLDVLVFDMIPRCEMWSGPEARQTPQRGCRPLLGLAAAAEEEQRETALGACHGVTVTPGISRRPNPVSKNPVARQESNAAPWSGALRTRQA